MASGVDFLLRRESEYLAIEAKARTRFEPSLLAGLKAIEELPGLTRRVLVSLGDRRLRTDDGIDVWPLDAFLEAVAANRLWP